MKKILFLAMITMLIFSCGTSSSVKEEPMADDAAAVEAPADETMEGPARKALLPFMAVEGVATVDGVLDAGEWGDAVKYPLLYNQLNTADLRGPKDLGDISGDFGLMFSGNMLYGYVTRMDDITFLDAGNVWENDCVEIFLDVDGEFKQLRSLVGEGWDGGMYAADAVWSADGSVFEFSCDMGQDMTGKIAGFLLALADNDGEARDYQLYPINGANDSWQGVNLGSVAFGADAEGEANVVVPFQAMPGSVTIDGAYSDDEWAAAVKYSLGYNQLNPTDQTFNKDYADFQGDWGIVYDGTMIYGFVLRSDDITNTSAGNVWENDCVELFLEVNGEFKQIRTVVGDSGWDSDVFGVDAVWSADGSVLEFSCDLGMDAAGAIIGFSLALADNDGGDTRESQLYPQTGNNVCWQGLDLAELQMAE